METTDLAASPPQDVTADRGPGVHFPPPFLFVAGFVAGWLVHRFVQPLPIVEEPTMLRPLELGGTIAVAAGVALVFWGMLTFHRARTAIIPNRPASRLVIAGPYRFTRNPMYVGLSTIHIGLALVLNILWPILFLPVVLFALTRLVIRHEERHLGESFGDEYLAYRRRVRRWL